MKDMTYEINSVKNTLANSIKYNYVDASTPKLGEWAERWDSREPCTGDITMPKLFYCTGFARISAFGPLSKFGGGRIYIVFLKC